MNNHHRKNQRVPEKLKQPDLKLKGNKKTSKKINDLFEAVDVFFEKKGKIFLIISAILMILVSIGLFDMKVSDGGDDSAYIVRAYNFIHNFDYPGGFQGALYPVVLSLFIKVFGINLPLLKSLSLVFILCFLFFFYKSCKKTVPPVLLYSVMLLISGNMYLLYYASQTYSETFFMMIQAVLFLIIFNYFISDGPEQITVHKDYKKFLILGFALFLVTLTKNIGFISIIAILCYFLLVRYWKTFLYTILSASLFILPFEIIKRIIWGQWVIQFQSQGTGLLYKDFYNPAKGKCGFFDFILRFIDNSNLYLSKHLYMFLGFKTEYTITPVLTVLTIALFIIAFISVFKKNKYLLFTGTYIGVMCAISFVILQKQWDQDRLIIIYYPYILIFIFGGFYYLLKKESLKKFQISLLILISIIFITTLKATIPAAETNKEILKKNLAGDLLYGLSPDWVNFIKMSKWAAENIPADKLIASRKPDISFVYTGRKFYPVYKVPSITIEELTSKQRKDSLPVSIVVDLNDIFPKTGLYAMNRRYIKAFILYGREGNNFDLENGINYVIYSFSEQYCDEFLKQLKENNIPYHKDAPGFVSSFKNESLSYLIYDPDMNLNKLKNDNVRYFILSKIRKNTDKSADYVNTMDRLLYYIELKYPIYREINKIGTDEDARLLEAQYEMVGEVNDFIKGSAFASLQKK
jgi:hypothetical protein